MPLPPSRSLFRAIRRRLAGAALALAAPAFASLAGPAAAQGYGSAAVANIGPPEAALFPDLAALQDRLEDEGWLLRGQATFILQGNTRFNSPYRGAGSLSPAANARNTLSTDLLLGRRLWRGAEVIVDASVTRGFGLSNSTGAAAFPNNEAFRLGSSEPTFFVPRAFLRQTIALSGDTVPDDEDPLRFNGPMPRERLTLTIGKFSVWDIFDDNLYAHDARTQFINWALVGAGAFDFSADARGWTYGAALEWENGNWAIRAGAFQVARRVNGLFMDPGVTRAWQVIGQVDRFYEIGGRAGAVRLLYGASRTRQSNWGELFENGFDTFDKNPTGYRLKQMLALNMEQALTEDLGAFLRLSWNDGRTQNWMFTEMDRAVSAGLSLRGLRWGREADTVGLGTNIGWISAGRRQYLEAGGIGFITGDGRLNYSPEWSTELYYDARIAPGLNLALNYQLIANPAYNADRGPVNVFALRTRIAF
ncbi:carbohydrate porin [Belnapia rosea]|uniref:carbohydrate porin n=1 Tax=Belnapia rosea TaxID=938405 RepID=UPI000884F38D|nr:carbohydrate porin [Belnapia rosea]SDB71187.1 Carbohydrate-selective porin, OprB family [Belnapia rosea]